MNWSYRVVRRLLPDGFGGSEEHFDIREIYYEDDGSIKAWSVEPSWPGGHNFQDLVSEFSLMREAFTKPYLDEANLPELRRHVYDDTKTTSGG